MENGKKDNSIINSLKRLERAGSENSRATAKLHDAVDDVSGLICEMAPVGTALPMGYSVWRRNSNIGGSDFLIYDVDEDGFGDSENYYVNGTDSYLHGDFNCWIPGKTRKGSLRFARDIANGLLDAIAAQLEEQAGAANAAAETLESVAAGLKSQEKSPCAQCGATSPTSWVIREHLCRACAADKAEELRNKIEG